MRIFLDTGNIEEIKKAVDIGILDGVTTNPTLIAKEGKEFFPTLKKIASMVNGPVNGEVTGLKAEEMILEGKKIARIAKNMVVKIPMTPEGIKAVKYFSKSRIPTNVTLVFSTAQALLAAKAGATYISPFLGRLDDAGHHSIEILSEIKQVLENYNFKSEIIAASIRSPRQVAEVALAGSHIATLPFEIYEKIFKHPLTDLGLKKFLEDWIKYKRLTGRK